MEVPPDVKDCLWSYDTSALDRERDKQLIITQVLNYGTSVATDWLFVQYSKEEITTVVQTPLPGRWDTKSLALWALVFDVVPKVRGRFSDAYALRSIG